MEHYMNGICYELFKNKNSKNNLVFVHGSGCNRKFFIPLVKKLKGFNCYLLDLPNHGKSEVFDDISLDHYIQGVTDFCNELENVTLIGHSLGGSICLGVVSKNLPAIKRCIIISSGAKYSMLDERILEMVRIKKVNWIYLMKCLGSLYNPEVLYSLLHLERNDIIIKDFEIDTKLDLEYTMKDINIPTLIMVSKKDILTVPEYSARMKAGIKGSRLIYFSRSRHMLPIAKSRQVANIINSFVHKDDKN